MKEVLIGAALWFAACAQEAPELIRPDQVVRISECPHGKNPAVLITGVIDAPTPSCAHGDMKRCAESLDGGQTWYSWEADLDGWCRRRPEAEL